MSEPMLPNFRYHVTTLAAVFMALGVGLLIGSSFVQPAVVQRQTRQLADLRNQFNRDVVALRDENRRYSDFVSRVSPRLLDNRLAGTRIALVQTGDYPETVQKIRETLEQAGATVRSVTVIDRLFSARAQTVDSDLRMKLRPFYPEPDSARLQGSAPIFALASALARGGGDADLSVLEDARMLQRDGDYAQPVDRVVIVGGASEDYESRADSVDLPLISQLKEMGMSVVFAEPASAGISYIASVRGADVATIDDADTDLGRVSVALALFGPAADGASRSAPASQ